jgi:hypothetical protein
MSATSWQNGERYKFQPLAILKLFFVCHTGTKGKTELHTDTTFLNQALSTRSIHLSDNPGIMNIRSLQERRNVVFVQ